MLNDALIKKIIFEENGRELSHVWAWAYDEGGDFETRRDAFFWILGRLLRDGHIRLRRMNGGEVLDGTPEELVDLFRKEFPKSEADADRICTKPGFGPHDQGFGMQVWWYLSDCPAGVMWLNN